jgi:pyrroline-5-carboxylate reductase
MNEDGQMLVGRKIGVIGAGNMGTALIRGWLKAGLAQPTEIFLADVVTERVQGLHRELGLQAADNRQVAAQAEIVLLAVKPQVVPEVLAEIQPQLDASRLVISIAAGIPLGFLAEMLPTARLMRVMPNTPTLVQAGMAAIAQGPRADAADLALTCRLFDAVGRSVVVDEKLMDAVTGLSGSGPAYVFLFLEALADGGVKMGLPRQTALLLAAQTILGAATLYLETQEHPGSLKDMVTSPGGTTIAGLHVLEQGGFRGLAMSAVETAAKRSLALAPALKPRL